MACLKIPCIILEKNQPVNSQTSHGQEFWSKDRGPLLHEGVGALNTAELLTRMMDDGDAESGGPDPLPRRPSRVLVWSGDPLWGRWLVATLRQQPPVPDFARRAYHGFFQLMTTGPDVDAPDMGGDNDFAPDANVAIEEAAATASLVLVLLVHPCTDAHPAVGAQHPFHLLSRLRAVGTPILVAVLVPEESAESDLAEGCHRLQQQMGMPPVVIRPPVALFHQGLVGWVPQPHPDVTRLMSRMLALCPRLALPLAQEIPLCRQTIAQRTIRTSSLLAAALAAHPIPLLELPMLFGVQWKLAGQIATIYGRPGLDFRSREAFAVLGLHFWIRLMLPQAAKFVPLVGWLLSAAVSGASTWAFGQALVRHYEQGRLLDWHSLRQTCASTLRQVHAPLAGTLSSRLRTTASRLPRGWKGRWRKPTAPPSAPAQDIPVRDGNPAPQAPAAEEGQ
jgi:uncharacterized protein (DUF697 family)